MKNKEVDLTAGGHTLAEVKFQRGYFRERFTANS